MKNLVKVLVLFLLGACQQTEKPEVPAVEQITEKDATELLDKWEQAMITKDSALLKEVLDPTYTYSGSPDGSTADRATMMEWVATDPSNLISQEFFDMDIKLYDNVAIVRGWEIITSLSPEGDTSQFKLRFTDVYKKENGITKALSTHSSPMD